MSYSRNMFGFTFQDVAREFQDVARGLSGEEPCSDQKGSGSLDYKIMRHPEVTKTGRVKVPPYKKNNPGLLARDYFMEIY